MTTTESIAQHKKAAGEFLATKQSTHRGGPARTAGLRVRPEGCVYCTADREVGQ